MISSITWAKAPVDLEQALTRGLAEQLWLLRQQADLSATRGVGYRDIQGIRGYYTLPVPPCCCAVQVWQRYPIHVYTVYRAYPGSIAGPSPDGPTPRIRPDGPVHLPRTVRTYPCWARKQVLFSIAGSQLPCAVGALQRPSARVAHCNGNGNALHWLPFYYAAPPAPHYMQPRALH